MADIRAKFICEFVKYLGDSCEVSLTPVIQGSEENKAFYSATPGGQIRLEVIDVETASQFEAGKEYFVDFTKAPETEKEDPTLGHPAEDEKNE